MARHWAVVDTNYLCHRAFHALGELSYEGVATAVVFGVFNDILTIKQEVNPDSFVFCFDHGPSLRKKVYPEYKANRNGNGNGKKNSSEPDEESMAARESLHEQIRLLETDYLPNAGFKNVQSAAGYEADDLIATCCQLIVDRKDKATIVGADHDLWQLLSKRVRMWNPNKRQFQTRKWFHNQWGLEPAAWVDTKAIAGCSSDNIKGIPRVGEKTAAKFLQGILPEHHKTYAAIVSGTKTWNANLPLVRLPYEGTPTLPLVEDAPTEEDWNAVRARLGIDDNKSARKSRPARKTDA